MARGKPLTPAQKQQFFMLHQQGYTIVEAGRLAGMGERSARSLIANMRRSGGDAYRELRASREVPEKALTLDEMCDEARDALEDFHFFRERYCGHISTPWQRDAFGQLDEAYRSDHREYLVLNVFPGSGKTTLLQDMATWNIVRDRTVRGMFGSRASNLATKNTRAVRRLLERTTPVKAEQKWIDRGVACDATGVLAVDFGRFRTQVGDIWRAQEFVVEQFDGALIEHKESTLIAFGFDQEYLGHRLNFAFWDDIDSLRNMSVDVVEKNREIFDRETEPRIEAGGLLVVCQQRLGPHDFSRHCLDKTITADDEDVELDPTVNEEVPRIQMYRHIVYRCHYEDRCTPEHHGRDAPAWNPDGTGGCLLEPARFGWREVRTKLGKAEWATVFQQEDVDPEAVLVQKLWVTGGRDPRTGEELPGCWDKDRGLCEYPSGLVGRVYSIATADPSPTKFWSIQWWLYHPDSEQRFLLDLIRTAMDAPDFLDWDHFNQCFTGIMEEWQVRSKDLGIPIERWVVEQNAAQRFLLQYQHVHRWMSLRGVSIIGHETHRNKSDPDFGVQTIAPHYRFGRVRLPGKQQDGSRLASMKLIDEVTRWPQGATDDCVMAHWMLEWNLPRIVRRNEDPTRLWRPSWVRQPASSLA